MHADGLFSYATLFGFLFTLARVSCVFAFLPLGAFRGAADAPKVFLSLGLTMILWPEWKGPVGGDDSIGRIVAGLAGEAALGFAIGLTLAIVLEVFQIAAQVVSIQAGFGFASTIDPASGADSTVLLSLAQMTAGLLFFATGADRLLVRALADSLRLCPPESFLLKKNWAAALIRFSGSIFGSGLRLAAPVVTLLLLTDAALAVLGRVQTQIQLVTLTLPAKLAASMLLLAATLAFQPKVFGTLMTEGIRLIEGMLRSGRV
ncbi:MAG: flagellar biosynthetic protein FliR [Acidobacteriota bacterium]